MKVIKRLVLGTALTALAAPVLADETWGDFPGYTLRVKLIGGITGGEGAHGGTISRPVPGVCRHGLGHRRSR